MKYERLLICFSLCSVLVSACHESKESASAFEVCEPNGTCLDATKVCINNYCLAKCTKASCGAGEVCEGSGLCVKGECSDLVGCSGDRVCEGNACVEAVKDDPDKGETDKEPTTPSGETASEGEKCDEKRLCASYLLCSDAGVCVKKCFTTGCESGFACNNDGRCVEGDCTTWQRCSENGFDDSYTCDTDAHKCVTKCSAGTCGTGKYCSSEDYLCHEGECSELDACSDEGKVCDLAVGSTTRHTCIDKCTVNDDCGGGKLCDPADGRCVEPCQAGTCGEGKACDVKTLLCIEAECSSLDTCLASYQVCDAGKCVDKCTRKDVTCAEGKVCDESSGICVEGCTVESCAEKGQICGNEGICVTGECSVHSPCAGGKVCSASYKCVDPVIPNNECYFYKTCDDCESKHDCSANDCEIAACESCEDAMNAYTACQQALYACLDAGNYYENCPNHCEAELKAKQDCDATYSVCTAADKTDCSAITASAERAACEALNACRTSKRSCLMDKAECEKKRVDCEARSKLCPEGKSCTADNRCVEPGELGGKGLGEACDPTAATSECGTGLSCLKSGSDKSYACLQSAYEAQGKNCTVGSYKDHCEGNIIVQCSSYYGQVMVYDCKTYYLDWDSATTGSYYGDNFACANRPGTSYVACVELCSDSSDKETYGCSYDTSDEYYEVDYSDRFICRYNDDGIRAYYYEDSEECTCNSSTGRCY